jgi:dGTP triphosphohydrolase
MAEDKSVPQGANKYSVYAQRDVDSTQFNWANAAADITKSFTDVRDDRKKRKEDLEDGFDKSMSLFQEVEAMQTKTAGEKITQASQMSVDSLVKQNQMMKNGEITVRDYQRFEGRLKSGYANVNKVVKNWDTWQGETNTRMTEGKSGYLEIGNAQDVQPLGEFAEHELVTNPFTGNLSYAKLIEDPNDPTKKDRKSVV